MNPRQLARLRKRLRPIAESLPLRGTDAEAFRRFLEDVRQRPVYRIPFSLRPELLGVWIASDTADYIFYERNTTPYHQRHIVLHEGSHMLRGHKGASLPDLVPSLCPHLDPQWVRSFLCHSIFTEGEEVEAEVLATLIEDQMEQSSLPPIRQASPEAVQEITRFFSLTR